MSMLSRIGVLCLVLSGVFLAGCSGEVKIGAVISESGSLADYGSPIRSHRFRHIHRDADGVPEIHDDIIIRLKSSGGTVISSRERSHRTLRSCRRHT